MLGLKVRLYLLIGAMFAITYGVISVLGAAAGVGTFYAYLVFGLILMGIQYWSSPYLVQMFMRIKYVSKEEAPELHRMVEELAKKAGIPKPKIGISEIRIPNAFAFGRSVKDGRVCVTRGILDLLDGPELKAVLGHEISHIKNRDMAFITLLSVIPMVLYHLAWSMMWSRDREGNSNAALGTLFFLLYFITNLLVLYGSRIREYYADRGSVELGNKPHYLASALYKLVYGSSRVSQQALKQVAGVKAFFANDPTRARSELLELRNIDIDLSGSIEEKELKAVRNKKVRISTFDKLLEIMSTHPNMLKRIKELAALEKSMG
ncbi:peptidase [Candidatus Woesearchaeota archaeon]|nr:MAG: peptidase [Candidatus Woesearchaeota archaeon]